MAEVKVANVSLQSLSETHGQGQAALSALGSLLFPLSPAEEGRQPWSSQNLSLISMWCCREKQQEENIMATGWQGKK